MFWNDQSDIKIFFKDDFYTAQIEFKKLEKESYRQRIHDLKAALDAYRGLGLLFKVTPVFKDQLNPGVVRQLEKASTLIEEEVRMVQKIYTLMITHEC